MKELLYLKDDQLKELIEKLFLSYRETFSDSKKVLSKYSLGLAHQKVIHLLSMYEGISISELMAKLKVTKQSLNRVLKDLSKLEIINFEKDNKDSRVKHAFLNEKGKKIFDEIFEIQKKRIYNALLNSSSEEVINFDNVLKKLLMDKFKAHILVVDDDDGIRSLVKKYLNENDYLVTTANSAEDAMEKINIIEFDLIILDIMMPGKSGLDFINEKKKELETPIILLTAKGNPDERIEGLEIGADDYLPKPFEPKELILRIKNIISKTKKINSKRVIEFETVKIDLNKLLISKNNKEFKINKTEKLILEKMINNPGKTFSREDIGKLIDLDKERSIDVIITRLRKKIESDPKKPKFLQTNRGAGYVLWIE